MVHANDWHTGLLPLLLKRGGDASPATLFTVHNLAFQGLFPADALGELRLPQQLLGPDGIEFYGRISFLKAGIRYSDRCNTVSPSYAREILTPEFGCGLDGLLSERAGDLSGILNGIDCAVWNPAADPFLPARFDAQAMARQAHLQGRAATRAWPRRRRPTPRWWFGRAASPIRRWPTPRWKCCRR